MDSLQEAALKNVLENSSVVIKPTFVLKESIDKLTSEVQNLLKVSAAKTVLDNKDCFNIHIKQKAIHIISRFLDE